MTRDEEIALCNKLKAKAALFVRDPAKGRAAGYQQDQRWERDPGPQVGLDRLPVIPMRSDYVAWLYGVAQKDLGRRSWTIIEGEGPEDTELILT